MSRSTVSGHQISCCLFSLHFLCDILATITVVLSSSILWRHITKSHSNRPALSACTSFWFQDEEDEDEEDDEDEEVLKPFPCLMMI